MSARGGRGRLAPYLVGLPGGLWLAIFFVVPLLVMFSLSLQSGNAEQGFQLHLGVVELHPTPGSSTRPSSSARSSTP